jgi:hypothetical protein
MSEKIQYRVWVRVEKFVDGQAIGGGMGWMGSPVAIVMPNDTGLIEDYDSAAHVQNIAVHSAIFAARLGAAIDEAKKLHQQGDARPFEFTQAWFGDLTEMCTE